MSRPRVAIVGAGPAGLAAAARFAEVAPGEVGVTLACEGGEARHLPGVLAAALGDRPVEDFVVPVGLPGAEVIGARVEAIGPDHIVVAGRRVDADAVVAAPGLVADPGVVPAWPRCAAGWDLGPAAAAAAALAAVPGGRLVVAACTLPYRCPPAPFSLALELAVRARRAGRFTSVCVATPESFPLAGVGGDAPGYLMEACAGAGVEVVRDFEPDLAASENGLLRAADGRELEYRQLFLIPPHRRSPLLAGLGGPGQLVSVDERGATGSPGLYAAGDCAASGLPRAAGVAEAAGRTAADAVLTRLGLRPPADPHVPSPSCFLWHGGGNVSRIRLTYPDGLPPRGEAVVHIDGPSPDLARAAEGERRRFLARAAGSAF